MLNEEEAVKRAAEYLGEAFIYTVAGNIIVLILSCIDHIAIKDSIYTDVMFL